jgi:hypothetical protein
VLQNLLAENGEHHDHPEGDQHRLPGGLLAHGAGLAGRQRDEDRHGARRIHDHEEGDEDRTEQRDVDDAVHGR